MPILYASPSSNYLCADSNSIESVAVHDVSMTSRLGLVRHPRSDPCKDRLVLDSQWMSHFKMSLSDAYSSAKRAFSSAPPNDSYLRWDAPGVETPKPDEDETAKKIGETMNRMQQYNFDQHRHAYRATHVKTQGIVKGKLTVLPNLPAHLQQGLFKSPGKTYNIAARYANEPVFLQADQESGPRGLGMRIFGVQGERLESADSEASTQDVFFNNAPSIELTDIDTCLEIMELREKHFDSPLKLAAATKLRTDAIKQSAPGRIYIVAKRFSLAHFNRYAPEHQYAQSQSLYAERV
jgi:hypothetical protein